MFYCKNKMTWLSSFFLLLLSNTAFAETGQHVAPAAAADKIEASSPLNNAIKETKQTNNETTADHVDSANTQTEIVAKAASPLAKILTISEEEARNRLGLTDDGNRRYSDENIDQVLMATPFRFYHYISLFKNSDFIDGKMKPLTDITVSWKNIADPNYDIATNKESFCNTLSKGAFEVTVSGKLDGYELKKTYRFTPKEFGICYLKPLSMNVNHHDYSDDFDPINGFSAGAGNVKFPTTGFKNAQFDVVLNKKFPREYRLQSSFQNEGVEVSGYFQEPRVTLTQIPRGTAKIDLLDGYGRVVDSYRFRIERWFVNSGKEAFIQYDEKTKTTPAYDFCKNYGEKQQFVPTSLEMMTNAHYKSNKNFFRRELNRGLMAEWGDLSTYRKANWSGFFYWLATPPGKDVLTVYVRTGQIFEQPATAVNPIVCMYKIPYDTKFLGF